MRNHERIDVILDLLGKLWKIYPDLRFNQLLEILRNNYRVREKSRADFFYLEDEEFEKFVKEYLEELKEEG